MRRGRDKIQQESLAKKSHISTRKSPFHRQRHSTLRGGGSPSLLFPKGRKKTDRNRTKENSLNGHIGESLPGRSTTWGGLDRRFLKRRGFGRKANIREPTSSSREKQIQQPLFIRCDRKKTTKGEDDLRAKSDSPGMNTRIKKLFRRKKKKNFIMQPEVRAAGIKGRPERKP